MTGTLGLRVVLALLVAGLGIFALDRLVRRGAAGGGAAPVSAGPAEVFDPVPTPLPPLGRSREILLVAGGQPVPAGVWQVAEVLPAGEVRLQRPPPLAQAPAPAPTPAAALLLPVSTLAELTPVQRGAVVDALSELAGGVPLHPSRVRSRGMSWRPEELRTLLRWQR